jgi:hypothetical protein
MHEIEVYELGQSISANGKTFEKGKTYIVPTEQTNYIMVRSAFEKDITYRDSTFYDASTWSLVHAFNMPHAEVRTPFIKGNQVKEALIKKSNGIAKSNYGYLMDISDYQAHKAIYQLQMSDVIVRTSLRPFTLAVNNLPQAFPHGTVMLSVQQQKIDADRLYAAIKKVSDDTGIKFYPIETGLTSVGIDLGSGSVRTVNTPKALMPIGGGVAASEAGEVWHLLDQRIGMPITKVDLQNFSRVNLNNYTSLIMVGGTYPTDKPTLDKIKTWIQAGGTLITFKSASEWAIKQGLTKEKLIVMDTIKGPKRLNFEDAADTEGAKQIGGSVFQVDLDLTNPIGFGFNEKKVSIYRNGRTFLQPSKSPFNTVAQYTANPLIGGYIHKSDIKRVANSAAILFSGEGQGRVILFSDNPNFRGTWYGTNKLFLNALFFGSLVSLPTNFGEE